MGFIWFLHQLPCSKDNHIDKEESNICPLFTGTD